MQPNFFSTKGKPIFLIDSIGAFISTGLLFTVGYFEQLFGIPKQLIYLLIPITTVFSLYSLACYLTKPAQWKRYLILIAIANLLYCCFTVGIIIFYFSKFTKLGVMYFSAEIVIIAALSALELAIAGNKPAK